MVNTYQLVTVAPARRALKKLPHPVRKHLVKESQVLTTNPNHGERLEGQWRFLRSFHTVYRRTHYRVIYEVDTRGKHIIIRYAATRENFYKTLRQLKLKPLSK